MHERETAEIIPENPIGMVAHRRGPRPAYGNSSRPVERLAVGPVIPKSWKGVDAVCNMAERPIAGWTGKRPPPPEVIKDARQLRDLLQELREHANAGRRRMAT
jgi:hypothetical protein